MQRGIDGQAAKRAAPVLGAAGTLRALGPRNQEDPGRIRPAADPMGRGSEGHRVERQTVISMGLSVARSDCRVVRCAEMGCWRGSTSIQGRMLWYT